MKVAYKVFGVLFFVTAMAGPASAMASAPAWSVQALSTPTNFRPGESSQSSHPQYQIFIANSGGAETDESAPIKIIDKLPAGLIVKAVQLLPPRAEFVASPSPCAVTMDAPSEVSTVSCEITKDLETKPQPKMEPARLAPGENITLRIEVGVPASVPVGPLRNRVEVEGGGAGAAVMEAENQVSDEDARAGFEQFKTELTDEDGQEVTAADSHPYQFVTSFGVNLVATPPGSSANFVPAAGDLKEVEVALPPGLVGNPRATERCKAQDFTNHHSVLSPTRENFVTSNNCPVGSVVGTVLLEQVEGELFNRPVPIYNLIPPHGMPAQLGFEVVGGPIYINTKLRSDSDYGITGFLRNVTEAKRVSAARISLWGTPWDASHNSVRGECTQSWETCLPPLGVAARPFWRVPSVCGNPLLTTMSFTTWAQPATGAIEGSSASPLEDCAAPPFTPTIEAQPSTNVADSPAGLHFGLRVPQEENEKDPKGLAEADLRDVAVTLPPGLVVNPASAGGRQACTLGQVGLTSVPGQSPIHFNLAPAQCPPSSKVGTVEANVPAIDHPITGSVYLARQEENPFSSLLAIYIVLEDPQSGIVVKLAGRVSPNPVTGQLTTTVTENPQVPVEDFKFDFFAGSRAPLRTPPSCGKYTTAAEMTPWTAPAHPSVTDTDSFAIGTGPQGSCPSGALSPVLSAGFANPTAGAYSPFSVRVSRADGTGEFAGLTTTPPPGFSAKLAGVPYCPQAGIDQAVARSHPGQGTLEVVQPSCPAASEIGTVTAGAGAGPSPFYARGKLYLAGPYKGAPLSLLAVIPAVAGPFDLGVVTDRVASYVNPETAQVNAVADPLPLILAGIPIDARDLRVDLDRPNFALAPTSCEPKSVAVTVTGVSGTSATVSDRFQVGGCNALRFKPGLSLKLSGGTKRGAHPAFKAVVTYPKGSNYANTARAVVALPHSEFLEQSHIRTICTRVQFAADACPKGSIYGKARAITPLLDKPLEGPVYLRSSSNPLPDLVLALHGQLDVDAVGRIDSHNGGIRSTFEAIPDAPLTKVILEMQGGRKGLFVNSRNICKHTNRATAKFSGQNGKVHNFRPLLNDSCKRGRGSQNSERQG